MAQLPSGVTGNSGLALNQAQVSFLVSLRRALPASVPLHVTSATRTPESQAAALVTKRQLGDDLYKLYRADQIVKELLAVPNTVAAMAPIIRRWADQGYFMSRHMRGDALDLRNRNLTAEQIRQIIGAAQQLGAKVVVETKPPHIHVEGISGASSVLYTAQEKTHQITKALTRSGQARRVRKKITVYKTRALLYSVGAAGVATLALIFFALSKRTNK